tara:strand:+ start:362 stop:868 length:507 start_codon:yes stop_codon:yes gene_type:complete
MEIETDWIKDFEENENSYNVFYKSQVDKIKIFSIYINPQRVIEKIKQREFNLNTNVISKYEIARIIKEHKTDEKISYKLISLLSYNNTLNPEYIKECIYNDVNPDYLTIHKTLNDITFDNSIKMFQDLSSLFLIFYELPKTLNKNNTKKIYLHSTSHRKTKRNRLKEN